jgi:hypothetical protein
MRITVVSVKLVFFVVVGGFKMEHRAEIKFCVKLKNEDTETY